MKNIIKNIHEPGTETSDEAKHLMIVRWSDDFEPNNVKKNKGNSIWTFSVTLISDVDHHHSEENTYILSLGPKNSDHTVIERKFLSDLRAINNDSSKKFYVANTNEVVSVKLHLIACVADLPERCDSCSISCGNGNHTTRFGWVSDSKTLETSLCSCKICFMSIISNLEEKNSRRISDVLIMYELGFRL